jgi:predicted Fe-Mo cluster-binding NifX family protein
MDIKTAVDKVSSLAEQNGMPVLEQLMDMQANLVMYSEDSQAAYHVFMAAGRKMFAPVDSFQD